MVREITEGEVPEGVPPYFIFKYSQKGDVGHEKL